jgi:Cu+-exporting ATPase
MARAPAGGELLDLEFSVPSMVCDGCAARIRQSLTSLPGIHTVKPKLWRKRVFVRYDASRIQPPEIKSLIAAAGYDAT